MPLTLEQLNAADPATAAQLLDGLYEHSPWIAEAALAQRPFRSLAHLKHAMAQVLAQAPEQARRALVLAHPELAGKAMESNTLTAESTHEQNQAGLTQCTPEELARIRQLNAAYLARFGFPFVLAVRGPRGLGLSKKDIIETFERRALNPIDFELGEALRNIHRIAEIRLNDKFGYQPTLGNDVWDWQERLAQHTDEGYAELGQLTVTYLTDAHRACAQRISHWMRECGFDEVQVDAVGNVVGRYHGTAPEAKTLLTGSHYDTVRNGGKYDGRLGIFVPMACVRELHRQAKRLPFAIEVVGFAEEEGQRYKATFLGSGALIGDFNPDWLEQKDAHGTTMRQAMEHAGLCVDDIEKLKRDPARYLGFVEVHIEQGPVLNEMDIALGVVTSINGSKRYACEMVGMASHAGTTPWTGAATPPSAWPNWRCTWSGARRRTATRWPPSASCTCPAARSTWCPGAASFRWTCARPPMRSATPWPATSWPNSKPLPSAAACASAWKKPWKRLPPRARPSGKSAGKTRLKRWACRCFACPAAPATTP